MGIPKRGIKFILFVLCILILIPAGFIAWNESFYFDSVPLLMPIGYPGEALIRNDSRGSGDFGTRRNGNRRHEGIDLLAPVGFPVKAAKGGIAVSGEVKKGMGKYVRIKHKNGLMTIYGHLSAVYIKHTQMVKQGQPIGEVGNTGNARYNGIIPHLHFEVRRHGVALDPKDYFNK